MLPRHVGLPHLMDHVLAHLLRPRAARASSWPNSSPTSPSASANSPRLPCQTRLRRPRSAARPITIQPLAARRQKPRPHRPRTSPASTPSTTPKPRRPRSHHPRRRAPPARRRRRVHRRPHRLRPSSTGHSHRRRRSPSTSPPPRRRPPPPDAAPAPHRAHPRAGDEVLIPYVQPSSINFPSPSNEKRIDMQLPEGLLDLNHNQPAAEQAPPTLVRTP